MSYDLSHHDPDVLFGDQLLTFESKLNQLLRRGNRDSILQALNILYNQVSTYVDNLESAYRKFREEDNQLREQITEKEALNELRGLCDDILNVEMLIALDINTEFNHPIFIERLQQAIYDPRTIQLNVINGILAVNIDLYTTGGALKDWADAVKATRKTFPKKRSPEPKRSQMWAEKFYGPAREGKTYIKTNKKTGKTRDLTEVQSEKYWNTIATRLELSTSIAPFWHILNYGISSYNDKSGGTAYPQNVPTHFVEKAIARIKAKYQSLLRKYLNQYMEEFGKIAKKYQIRIQQGYRILSKIQDALNRYSTRAGTRMDYLPPDPTAEIMNYLRQHLGDEKFLRAERAKLVALAEKLSRGEEIASRVSLGHGVRTRTTLAIRRLRGY